MFIWNSFIGCINHWQVAFVFVCQYLVYSSCVPFVDRWKECLFLYFSLLFIGPGCIVMIGMTEELAKEKSFSPVRLFIKTFRQFWLKGFFYWLFAWIVSVIMIFDCFFFIRFSYGKWLIPLFVLLACLSVSFSINYWYFQVRNPASKPNQVLRIAFYYTLKKWYVSLLDFYY